MAEHTEPPGDEQLLAAASNWMREALSAWVDDEHGRVGLLAPLAVELLGKAFIWRTNPTLLSPLGANAEDQLLRLAREPRLSDPKLRTVGLDGVLRRLAGMVDGFPLDPKGRTRMVEARNGAVHIGTAKVSRGLVLDSLAVAGALLAMLGKEPIDFYGSQHHLLAAQLLDEKRTDAELRVMQKRAKARQRLTVLEEQLGEDGFSAQTEMLESWAGEQLDPSSFGLDTWGIDRFCPECGLTGRLFGDIDIDADVDYDHEPNGDGSYHITPYVSGWVIGLHPSAFACNVCRLTLRGADELRAAGLETERIDGLQPTALGPYFDADEYAEAVRHSDYGSF